MVAGLRPGIDVVHKCSRATRVSARGRTDRVAPQLDRGTNREPVSHRAGGFKQSMRNLSTFCRHPLEEITASALAPLRVD